MGRLVRLEQQELEKFISDAREVAVEKIQKENAQ
jgi:hypothetical protein